MTVHDSSKGGGTHPQVVLQDRDAMRCVTFVDDDDSDDDGDDGYNDGDGDGVSVFRRPRWIATRRRKRRRRSNQRRHAEDGVGYVSWEEVETTTRKG